MNSDPQTTFDALRLRNNAEAFRARLAQRLALAATLPGLEREKAWLADGDALVGGALEALSELLRQSERLPEREGEREDFARGPQALWVDELERLWAGVSFHLGRRAPLLEALFPHTRFALLRKPKPEAVRTFAAAFDKRLAGSYVQRMLTDADAAFATPVLEAVRAALATWEETLTGPSLAEAEAAALRARLALTSRRLETAHRQARHLLEAAQLGLPEPEPELTPAFEAEPELQAATPQG